MDGQPRHNGSPRLGQATSGYSQPQYDHNKVWLQRPTSIPPTKILCRRCNADPDAVWVTYSMEPTPGLDTRRSWVTPCPRPVPQLTPCRRKASMFPIATATMRGGSDVSRCPAQHLAGRVRCGRQCLCGPQPGHEPAPPKVDRHYGPGRGWPRAIDITVDEPVSPDDVPRLLPIS